MTSDVINVVYLDMAIGIPEQVTLNDDGSYTVFLNARYSYEYLQEAMAHAMGHIRREDHYKDMSADEIEREAHRCASPDMYEYQQANR